MDVSTPCASAGTTVWILGVQGFELVTSKSDLVGAWAFAAGSKWASVRFEVTWLGFHCFFLPSLSIRSRLNRLKVVVRPSPNSCFCSKITFLCRVSNVSDNFHPVFQPSLSIWGGLNGPKVVLCVCPKITCLFRIPTSPPFFLAFSVNRSGTTCVFSNSHNPRMHARPQTLQTVFTRCGTDIISDLDVRPVIGNCQGHFLRSYVICALPAAESQAILLGILTNKRKKES